MELVSNANYDPIALRKIEFSRHAQKRAQQRAIPQDCLPLIKAYGERTYDGHGGVRYLLTERAIAKVARVIGHSQRLEMLSGSYAVLDANDEQTVITLGHRFS